jgi:hypothetical protein
VKKDSLVSGGRGLLSKRRDARDLAAAVTSKL